MLMPQRRVDDESENKKLQHGLPVHFQGHFRSCRIQLGQEIVELIDFFGLLFSVEEAELSVAHEKRGKKVKGCAYLINFFPVVEDY